MKRKILQICKYNLNAPGGIENVSKVIHLGLKDSCYVVSLSFKRDRLQAIFDQEVSKKITFRFKNQPISFGYLIYLIKTIRSFDQVIYHHPNPFAMIALLIFLKPGIKLSVFWHSDILKGRFLGLLMKPLEKATLSYANNIIFTSKSYLDASYIKPHLKNDRATVLPLGTAEPLSEYFHSGIISRPIKLIFIGRLEPYKGVLEMLDELNLSEQEVDLTIVGDGSLLEKVFEKSEILKNNIKVQVLTNLNNEEKNKLLCAVDFLILPSRSRAEAYGMVLIEALSMGTPIITRKVEGSGMNDIVSDHCGKRVGFMYGNTKQSTLRVILDKVSDLSDSEYQIMRRAAKEKFESHYKIETFEKKFRDLILNEN